MSTSTIEMAGLEGGRVELTPSNSTTWTRGSRARCCARATTGWDDAVLVWNGMVARAPALVVQPTSAGDVAAAVGFAREHGLLLSIKGGGHNIAGHLDRRTRSDARHVPDARRSRSIPPPGSPTLGPDVCSRTSTGRRRSTGSRRCSASSPRSASPA